MKLELVNHRGHLGCLKEGLGNLWLSSSRWTPNLITPSQQPQLSRFKWNIPFGGGVVLLCESPGSHELTALKDACAHAGAAAEHVVMAPREHMGAYQEGE